eukprot:scaffold72302_cov18-Tisochrysis_lutea.AAC.7
MDIQASLEIWPDRGRVKPSESFEFCQLQWCGIFSLHTQKNYVLHIKNTQEASRRAPVKQEQSNFEVQTKC